MALGLKLSVYPFAHGAAHRLPDGRRPLRQLPLPPAYNTQTKRLTPEMFRAVFRRIQEDSPCP